MYIRPESGNREIFEGSVVQHLIGVGSSIVQNVSPSSAPIYEDAEKIFVCIVSSVK
jgi:hypothetical protein